jgi:uncharacterized protein (DUF433 family)
MESWRQVMAAVKKTIDWSSVPSTARPRGVEIDPERQSGAPVFVGTRIPVDVVTNNIHHGGTKAEIDEILENFDVSREHVGLVLRELHRRDSRPLASERS